MVSMMCFSGVGWFSRLNSTPARFATFSKRIAGGPVPGFWECTANAIARNRSATNENLAIFVRRAEGPRLCILARLCHRVPASSSPVPSRGWFSFSHLNNEIVILWITMDRGLVISESERPVTPDREGVERELAAILKSSHFRGSRRCHDFLSLVVNKTLAGQKDSLKEREIAIAVFGLKPEAHMEENSIVRVGAREVRKRLEQYYMSDGRRNEIRIDLPNGSYAPVFQLRSEIEAATPPVPLALPVERPSPRRSRKTILWLAGGLAALGIGALFLDRKSGR